MPVVGGYEGLMESQKHDMGQVLSALSGAGKLQDMELHADRARLLRAQAGLAENELGQEQALAQAMSQMGQGLPPEGQPTAGQPQSRAAPLYRMADIAFRAGAVKKAQEFLSKASTIEHQEVQNERTRNTIKFYEGKNYEQDLERLTGFYEGVDSQEKLDEANARYQAAYPDRPLPRIAQMPYSPYMIRGLKQSLLTEQQRAAAVNKDQDQEMRAQEIAARRAAEARRAAQAEEAARLRREREARLAKAGGGKPTSTLGKDYPVLAAREITDSIFNGTVPPEFKQDVEGAKTVIASRAMQLRQQEPALSMDQAVARAVQESREAGEWTQAQAVPDETFLGVTTKKGTPAGYRFKSFSVPSKNWGAGLSPEKKQELANLWSAAKPAPADRKFQDGVVYETPRGRLMRSGGKWYTQQEWAER